jgi:hypothetical protein
MSNPFCRRRAIYIGQPRCVANNVEKYGTKRWFEKTADTYTNFGCTGYADLVREGQWAFQPDGMNISHNVCQTELQLYELTPVPKVL